MHNFRNMRIYGLALDLVAEVYRLSQSLPREETFGLQSQLRRAAVSVVLNIAEGSGASSDREFRRFLDIARRSAYEIDACFEVCIRLRLLQSGACAVARDKTDAVAAMVSRFRSQLRG